MVQMLFSQIQQAPGPNMKGREIPAEPCCSHKQIIKM